MKHHLIRSVLLLALLSALLLAACGAAPGGEAEETAAPAGPDPVSAVELSSTEAAARSAEPELTDYEKEHYLACDKAIAGVPGKLLVYFNAPSGEPLARSVFWNAEPEDGSGRSLYDQLYAGLTACYGQPALEREEQDVASVNGAYDMAQARWDGEGWQVSLSYIEYRDSGLCQVQYKRGLTQ